MARNIIFIVAFICFGIGQPAYGQTDLENNRCDNSIVDLVGKYLDIRDFSYPKDRMYPSAENGGVIIAGVCKVWPKDNSKTIGIFAYDDGVEYEKRLIVVLVDAKKIKIVAIYKGAIQEDAAMTVGASSFRIDTARYDLAPSIRAFGLDITTSYSQGCVDGGLGPERTLFVQEGENIRPILENFYTSSWRYVQGGPSCTEGENVVTEDITYSIGIDNETTNGYADLIITATSSGAKTRKKPFKYKIKYDGRKYPSSLFNGAGVELDNWQSVP